MILDIHEKFRPLYVPMRYKVFWGGRNGMKTWSFSEALVIIASQETRRIICGRQYMNTIEDSVKPAIENQIARLGLEDEFDIQETKIIQKITGSSFRFKGLERNLMSIKGWEDVDIFWGEEGHTITQKAFDLLTKTIRKAGSELWFSFNRHRITDPIDRRFLAAGADTSNAIVQKVGWRDNPHLSDEQKAERIHDLKYNSDRYAHIWEGEPEPDEGKSKVLPYEQLLKAVDAHKTLNYQPQGMNHAGLDVADEGNDTNAWAKRKMALLMDVKEWKAKYLHITANKAALLCDQNNIMRMYYDAGGLGAGIKSDFARINANPQNGWSPNIGRFIPFHFGGAVRGPDKYYIKHKGKDGIKISNKDFFSKVNAQAWWNLKLRLENTLKVLDGEKINLDKCFFLSGKLDNLENVLLELSQCVYDDSTGKIKIDKAPEGRPSPNLADSIVLSFAHDIRKGLKSN